MRIFTDLLFAQGHFATPTALREAGLLENEDDASSLEAASDQKTREAQKQIGRRPNLALSHGWS